MSNDLNRAIYHLLSNDTYDNIPSEITTIQNDIIAKYPTVFGTNYFMSSGRWHTISLKTLLWGVNAPSNWYDLTFKTGSGGHNQARSHSIKVNSNLSRNPVNENNRFTGTLNIEIIRESSDDESLISCIANRIYWYLMRCNNGHCQNTMICLSDPCNSVIDATLQFVDISGNYDRQVISYIVRDLTLVNDILI